jgi:hypothetical protein
MAEPREIRQLPRKHVRAAKSSREKYAEISYDELRSNNIPAKAKRRRLTKLSIKEVSEVF